MSQGTPMLLMGDEVRRTQGGNNNSYVQDNEINWFNWNQLESNAEILQFTQKLIQFTSGLEILRQEMYLMQIPPYPPNLSLSIHNGAVPTDTQNFQGQIEWHGVHLSQPDWSEQSHSLAFSLCHRVKNEFVHVILNAYWEPLQFQLPILPDGKKWRQIVNTALPSPHDIFDNGNAPVIDTKFITSIPYSSIILIARSP